MFFHSPYTTKTLRKAIVFDLSRYSNWFFVATTGLTSSIKIWKEDHTFIDADSIEKLLILIHGSNFCWSKNSRKVHVKTIHIDYRIGISPWPQAWLPAWGSLAATLLLEKGIRFKYQSAVVLQQNLDNPKNRVLLLISIFNLNFPSVWRLSLLRSSLKQKLYPCKKRFAGKKFSNRSKNLSRNVKFSNFSSFWDKLCFIHVVSPGTVIAIFLWKTSTGTCLSVILRLKEYQKAQLLLNIHYVATHFSPRIRSSHLSFVSKPETFHL